jgi:hypothetical protein
MRTINVLTPLSYIALLPAAHAAVQTPAPTDTAPKQESSSKTNHKSQAVIAVPAAVSAGDPVTLRWYFTGDKVTVSGGRFGNGSVVTGRTAISDRPTKTTRYTFNVDYRGQKVNSATGKTEIAPLHATYSVVVAVSPAVKVDLNTYRDRYGWQIACLKSWKRDPVSFPDPANNALIYFQQEDDSVERLAVSVLPADQMTATQLMGKAQKSLPSNYEQLQVISDEELTFSGVPAVFSIFTGMDQSHPGTKTESLMLAFVKEGRAYVLSARTAASQFPARRPVLEKLVRSFTFTAPTTTASR